MHDDALVPRQLPAGVRPRYRRFAWRSASAAMFPAALVASVWLAPASVADSVDNFRAAVLATRPASCPPLRNDPLAEQTATLVNKSTSKFLDLAARAAPIPDPLPVLKDLGYGGDRAKMLQGAGFTDADAIKGALLQGFAALQDCSYTDFGVSLFLNDTSQRYVSVVVLAGAAPDNAPHPVAVP